MDVNIRVSGLDTAVRSFVERLKKAGADNIVSVSREYRQTRYDKNSKEIAVYITVSENV